MLNKPVDFSHRNRPRPEVPSRARRAFTLPEVLVTLAIVSLLAAVLIPAVAGQIGKGDVGRTVQDLTAVQTGIQQFLSDVHRYPGKISNLSVKITTSNKDITQTVYNAALVSRWKGPYMAKDTSTFGATSGCLAACTGLATALGGVLVDSLSKFTNTGQAVDYVAVMIYGIGLSDFNKIDEIVDGTVSATSGLLRFGASGNVAKPDTIWFLAVPIQ
jgi:prepilin-type N-terminal cleavage/methylation domain-containing protein